MKSYVPATHEEQARMLAAMGLSSIEELLRDIPDAVRCNRALNLPEGLSEAEALARIKAYARENSKGMTLFRGAGAYRHFIPSVIQPLVSRGEFLSAYTPYQFEMSQGMLQAIFEYQSLIARLTGMDASNASVYDGATAAAEAMLMCRDSARREKVLASQGLHPDVLRVLRTYAPCVGVELVEIPLREGVTDLAAVEANAEGAAGLIAASPNYLGLIEDTAALAERVHAARGLMVSYVEPISLGLLRSPGDLGADIAIGDGQPLGIPLSFGGPYVGFMAVKQRYLRNLPGRIVGETTDDEGNRAYVLTLQAREQHIRREKATSNICSNQSLCAIMAAIYLTAMGPQGLREVAEGCLQRAHYAAERIAKVPGMKLLYDKPFFMEFVIESKKPARVIDEALRAKGIVGGLPLDEHSALYCVTETNTRAEIDALVEALEVIA
ncbi:aminomethyl-transferring glycine dehydrogenase subunit GcvPA [Eubacteriales bacterium OttesenSCG-928-A19]|nr:aminomethyl-transferring glycine dehydrogenase subunit GcvPA [Eubacteriales bacterium OttesenSCG-928-A19]